MAKAQTVAAKLTPDLFTGKRRPGRPVSPDSMTLAQRQAKFRQRHKMVNLGETMTQTVARLAADFDLTESDVMRHLVRFALCNRNWSKTGFPSA